MPSMWFKRPFTLSRLSRVKLTQTGTFRSIHGPQKKVEYSQVAQYPKIPTHKNSYEKNLNDLKDTVKNLGTVEEKQYFINKPKYYGWYSCIVEAQSPSPETLELLQYATNTTLINGKLPGSYGNVVEEETEKEELKSEKSALDLEANRIANELEPVLKSFIFNTALHCIKGIDVENDLIPFHEAHARVPEAVGVKIYDRTDVEDIVRGINRIILAHLRVTKSHLRETVVDHSPRTEAFWFRGGIRPDLRMMKRRTLWKTKAENHEQHELVNQLKETFEECYDRTFQFKSDSILQFRGNKMISPYIKNPENDEYCTKGFVPQWNYSTQPSGYCHKIVHGVNLPGCWGTSPNKFITLAFVNRINKNETLSNITSWDPNSKHNSQQEMILSKALISSFSGLFSSACFQGFDPFNDPTHPFTTQTIVTDGRKFKFSVSQLNTTSLIDVDEGEKLVKRNVMWHIPEVELYKSIDENGVKGFRTDVLATLVKFYLMEPTVTESQIDTDGYLDDLKYVHNVTNNYNREAFTGSYRHMVSNRPRHFLRPEILPYQKLFMIDHPEVMFAAGNREKPWFRMRKSHYLGRRTWDPEFKPLDDYRKFKPAKFRTDKNDKGYKTVTAPIDRQDEKSSTPK